MNDTKIFNRTEKKYLITAAEKRKLLKIINSNMAHDDYYESGVYNIYFDTDNYDLIIQSIDHPIFKEKLRARSYEGYDEVFFEIKTKILGLAYRNDTLKNDDLAKDENHGYKRRVLITHQDYDDYVHGRANMVELASRRIETGDDLQIAKEVDYFVTQMNLKPKILVYYDRESYKGENGLRITFDHNLSYRTKNLKFIKKSTDQTFFSGPKNIIMEIKASGAMPLWLVKALSAAHIYPQRFSKIGNIYERIQNV